MSGVVLPARTQVWLDVSVCCLSLLRSRLATSPYWAAVSLQGKAKAFWGIGGISVVWVLQHSGCLVDSDPQPPREDWSVQSPVIAPVCRLTIGHTLAFMRARGL